MKIAIYARKSKYSTQGESIEIQIQQCMEEIEKSFPGAEVIIYQDEGYSGGNSDRPEFKRMINAVEKGLFDTLICYRLDRISRSVMDFSNIIEILEDNNITFISVKEKFDTSTPMGRAMMFISSVFAQLERETIAERIKDNFMKLARTGRWLGGVAPTGFKGKRDYYYDDEMKKRSAMLLIPVEEELNLVETIYQKYIELDSLSGLLTWTLQNNIKSRNGKDFDLVALKRILTNTVYAKSSPELFEWFVDQGYDVANEKKDYNGHGVFTTNKYQNRKNKAHKIRPVSEQVVAVAKHSGRIESKDWIKVQEMLEENSKKAPRRDTGKHGLIQSILYCENCGSRMRVQFKYSNGVVKHHYYKCRLKEDSHGSRCKMQNANGIRSDEAIINTIKQAKVNKGMLAALLKEKINNVQQTTKINKDGINLYVTEIQKLEKSIENLTMQLSENQSSVAAKYIIKQIEDIDSKINDMKKKLSAIRETKISSEMEQENLQLFFEAMERFDKHFDDADIFEQRKLVQDIIKRIEWDGENLKVYPR